MKSRRIFAELDQLDALAFGIDFLASAAQVAGRQLQVWTIGKDSFNSPTTLPVNSPISATRLHSRKNPPTDVEAHQWTPRS